MNNINSVDVEQIVETATERFFTIILVSDGKSYSWMGNQRGFMPMDEDNDAVFIDTHLVRKKVAIEEYYNALREAKKETKPPLFESGKLEIVAIGWPQD